MSQRYDIQRPLTKGPSRGPIAPVTEKFNACFISYRHPAATDNREAKLITHVVKAITDHVQMYTHDHEVYFDNKRLVPGYQYDENLSEAICRSACMVIVYWPAYLESDYCKKELAAMLEIEERRRKLLGKELHGKRLFIPVILRGRFDELPEQITKDCQFLDYKAQAVRPNFNIGDDETMSTQLYNVAEYIHSLRGVLRNMGDALFGTCRDYAFPGPLGQQFANAIKPPGPPPFPGR